jgi:two-component system nitrogen regulation response regulator GlnG
MPGLSGLELVGHVRQKYPNTPVIIMTGISDQAHAQGLMRLGAFDYLLKPFRLEVVEASVRKAVAYRQQLVQDSDRENERQNQDPTRLTIVKKTD